MKNPHILHTLPILYLFGLFKIFWGIIWLGCCLNRSVTLRRWSNDIRKNRNPKNTKNFTRVRRMWGILTFFVPSQFSIWLKFLKLFWHFILLVYCLNRFITLRRWWNNFRTNPNPKMPKNSQECEVCEESSHSSYPPNSPLVWRF